MNMLAATPRVFVDAATDVGLERENNEDAFGYEWLADGSLVAVVADGMGGHAAGEVASSLAVEGILQFLREQDGEIVPPQLRAAIHQANESIIESARSRERKGMGTTVVVLWLKDNRYRLAWAGDSRFYHCRGGQIVWRTTDHTRAQRMVDRGELTVAEMRDHPASSLLTRALGHRRTADGSAFEPQIREDMGQLAPGDILLMSTDGLHDLVTDSEVAALTQRTALQQLTSVCIKRALDRGGRDNVTVTVVSLPKTTKTNAAVVAALVAGGLAALAAAGIAMTLLYTL